MTFLNGSEYIKLSPGPRIHIANAYFHRIEFIEGDQQIIYIPSMNMSAYGHDLHEANVMMQIVLKDVLNGLTKCSPNEVYKELMSLGWTQDKNNTNRVG